MGDYLEGAAASNQGTAAGGENNYSLKSASCPQHPTPFLSWGGAINFTRICQHTLAKGAMFGSCSYWSQQKATLPWGLFKSTQKIFWTRYNDPRTNRNIWYQKIFIYFVALRAFCCWNENNRMWGRHFYFEMCLPFLATLFPVHTKLR